MKVDNIGAAIAVALGCLFAIGSASCTVDVHVFLPGHTGIADDDTGGHDDHEDGDGSESQGSADAGNPHASLDLGGGEGFAEQSCRVGRLDAPLPCAAQSPSTVIDPTVAWTWTGPNGEDSVIVTPLVANLDDDNLDGSLDLCDAPDVLVLAVNLPASKNQPIPPGRLYVLDSNSGATKLVIDHPLDATATPALADLDNDGVPEILAFERTAAINPGQIGERRVVAFAADGSLRWTSDTTVLAEGGGALAVADLDGNGQPEILAPEHVLGADGQLLWAPPEPPLANSVPVAADLDLDGDLEVVFGSSVYSHHGVLLFDLQLPAGLNAGVAAIANFDDDAFPEIYVQSSTHRMFEHDGTPKLQCGGATGHPVAIEDLDGDGKAEILNAYATWFSALTIVGDQCVTLWSSKIDDPNAISSGTAFDFLADGSAEALYADLESVRLFDGQGQVIAQIPRQARSTAANPVVVDADNDGAAEIVLVGSEAIGGDTEAGHRASVILVQNSDDRFAPTRRIWNQHAYHGTNIREDASVPAEQEPHWLEANSFRTNSAPSYVGELCQPPDFN